MRKQQREKLLFRYSSALARGDFAAVAAILAEAERDPALARQLAEIDAVYAIEPIPTFSLNGHRREKNVSVYVESAPKPRVQRFNPAFVYAAAVLVVILMGTLLFANRPDGDDDVSAILPAAQASETPTPFPTLTFTPQSATALPPTATSLDFVLNVRPDDVYPSLGSVAMPVMCTGQTNAMRGMELRSLPTLQQGIVIGYMPFNTPFNVVDMYQGETEGWYFVVGEVGAGLWRVQGWLQANALITNGECIYSYSEENGLVQLTYIIQSGDTLLSIAVQYGLDVEDLPHLLELNNLGDGSALPAPGQTLIIEVPSNRPLQLQPTVVPPVPVITSTPIPATSALETIQLTLTQIIADATATAQAFTAPVLDPIQMTATQIVAEATARAATATPVSP